MKVVTECETLNILFHSPYAGNWYLHTLWEGTIAHSLMHRGANVRFVGCDSAFRACDIFWDSTNRTEAGCLSCQQVGRQVFAEMHLESSYLGEQVTAEDRAEIKEWLATLSDGELFDGRFDSYPVGEWCRASLIAHYRQPRFEPLSSEQAETLRAYIEGASIAIRSLSRQIDSFQPELLVTLNGTFFSHRVAFELARERGIRVVVHERGMLPETLLFNENQTIWQPSRMVDFCETWRDIPLSKPELLEAAQYLNDRRYGKRLAWHALSPPPQALDMVRRKLNIRLGRQVVSLFTTSQSEASTSERKGNFPDMIEWVTKTIAWFKERPEYHLVVRIHPNEDHVQGKSAKVLERYQAVLTQLPENVSVIWPKDDVSSYTLLDLSSTVLVHDTTVGLEAAASRGLPVGVVGYPTYLGWGFTFDLDSPEQYAAFLENLVLEAPSDEIRRRALRSLYRTYFTLSIPFPQVSVINISHGQLNYSTLDELAPGRSSHLDRIADGLMGIAPLYPDPSADELARTTVEEDAFLAQNSGSSSSGQKRPKVSVVAYVYNYAHYLDAAIQSVLDQTYGDFELYILDDGSTDGTAEVVAKYLGDPRVRYEFQENKGRDRLHETFNRCLEATSGEFIVIANGDDLMHPEKLQRQLDAFKAAPELEVVFHDATFIDAAGEVCPGSFDMGLPEDVYAKSLLGRYMFRQNQIPNPTVMFKRSILRRIGLQEYGWMHDYQFWLKAAVARCCFRFLPERLLYYRVHEESHSTSSRRHDRLSAEDRRMRREMRARYEISELFPELSLCQDMRLAQAYAHLELGIMFAQGGLPILDEALAEFQKAVELAPELPEARNNLAVAKFLEGKQDEAIRIWRDLTAFSPIPEAEHNYRLAQALPSQSPLVFQLRIPDRSPLEPARARLSATTPPREEVLQATQLAWLDETISDEAVVQALKAYFASHAPGDVLILLTDSAAHNDRVSILYEAARQQIGFPPERTPDVVLQQVKPAELRSVFQAQALEARTVLIAPPEAPDGTSAESAAERDSEASDPNQPSPLISVIIPTYSRPDDLARAIKSVLAQTFQDFEIVVVNDAGVSAEQVIESFASEQRITYIRHPRNKGLAASRNTGIKAARGKYIAYLDDDDAYYPDHLQSLVSTLESSHYQVAYTDAYRIHQARVGDAIVEVDRDVPFSFEFSADHFLVRNYVPVLCFLHEKSCLDATGLFDESLTTHEDWDLWVRLSQRFPFIHVPRVTCEFSWRTDGSTMSSSRNRDFLRTLDLIYEKYRAYVADRPDIAAEQQLFRANLAASLEPDANAKRVSIIIPLYNQVDYTVACLEALAQNTPEAANYEVILVDNASSDGTEAFLQQLSGDVIVHRNEQNLGFAKACNQGARLASGEILLFLNNDTIPHPGWLEGMLDVFASEARVGAVGSKLLFPDGTIQHAGVVFADDGSPGHWLYQADLADHPLVNQRRDFQCVTAACIAIPRPLFEQLEGFDEGYRNGYEDVDLCLKIRKAGYRVVYTPDSVVTHVSSVSEGRKDFDDVNLQRLLKRWSGKILPDLRRYYAIATGSAPTFSVVVVTCNSEATIGACLKRVLPSLGADDEILIFDNASSDRTLEIVREFAMTDSRVKLVESPRNLGLAGGMEQGVGLSSGEYLAILRPEALVTRTWLECAQASLSSRSTGTVLLLGDAGLLISRSSLEEIKLGEAMASLGAALAEPARLSELGFQSKHIEGAVVQYAPPSAQERPGLRVLALIYALEPCPLIRLIFPLQEAERQDLLEVRFAHLFDEQFTMDALRRDIEWADIVIFQRFSSPQHLELMALCHSLGKRVVFETDDDLLNLPPTNPHHAEFQRADVRAHIESLAAGADMVTVSTPQLAAELATLNRQISVLPNTLPDHLFPPVPDVLAQHCDGPVVIGYAGTSTHQADLSPIVPALKRLLDEFPEKVLLVFMGCAPADLNGLPGVTIVPETPDYAAFVTALRTSGMHIGLAPLVDHAFNHSKSAIKWMEYAACGIVPVCSNLGPYRDTVRNGVDGLLIDGLDADTWYRALRALILDPVGRGRIARQAHDSVRREHMLSQAAKRWADAYRQLAGWEQPQVSIVIPLYNKVEYTQKCLEALIANTPSEIDYEVILVDNASSDGTSAFLAQLEGNVHILVNSQNLGFAKACNQGAAIAKGRYILFLNNDTEPKPGWLEPLLCVLNDDAGVGAVGARLLYPDGTLQHAGVTVTEDLQHGLSLNCLHRFHRLPADFPEANVRTDVQVVTGAALMIRRALFHEVGGFDEGYWNGNEDVDLCFTLGQRGWRIVYEPQSCLVHHESVSGPERWRKVNENIQRLLQRWSGRIVPDELIDADGAVRPHPSRPAPGDASGVPERVSIVLLGYNQLAFTKLCVESVLAHSDRPFELILVDNGSVDGTGEYFRALAARDSRVKAILNPRNEGFAVGCNQGIAAAMGDYVLFLNNDTIVPRKWLSRMLAHFEAKPTRGAIGAVSNCVSGPQQLQKVPVPNHPDAREAILAFGDEVAAARRGAGFELARLVGFCLMVRRAVLDQIGGFDPHYGIGNYEDDDLCLRIRTAGFETWVAADVYVHHFGSRTFAALGPHAFDDTMDQGWSRFKQKWNLPPHLDRRNPYRVILPVFDPRHHAISLAETLPVDLADPFRPGMTALELHDRRQTSFFHHPDWSASTWPLVISSFARAFAAEDDVSLVIWLDPSQGIGEEEAGLRILDALTQAGIDPEQAPDILLVPDVLDLEGLARLYAATDCVVSAGNKSQADRAERMGLPVLDDLAPHAWHRKLRRRGQGERGPALNSPEEMPK